MTSHVPQFTFDRLATPLGTALLLTDDQGRLCALDWQDYEPRMLRLLRSQHRAADVTLRLGRAPSELRERLLAYFAGTVHALEAISVFTGGTAFQREVWGALRMLSPGETVSYAELAARLGRPRAMRAVGLANGSNPIAVVVPCHRVIGTDGSLTGYAGGLSRKRWLLDHERASCGARDVANDRQSITRTSAST